MVIDITWNATLDVFLKVMFYRKSIGSSGWNYSFYFMQKVKLNYRYVSSSFKNLQICRKTKEQVAVIRTDKSEKKIKQAEPNLCEFLLLIIQATCSFFKICQVICAHVGAHHTQIDHIFPLIKYSSFGLLKWFQSKETKKDKSAFPTEKCIRLKSG